jgi:hypothetical protein
VGWTSDCDKHPCFYEPGVHVQDVAKHKSWVHEIVGQGSGKKQIRCGREG